MQSIRCPVTAGFRCRLLGSLRRLAAARFLFACTTPEGSSPALHSTGLSLSPARFGLPLQGTVSVNVSSCMYHNIDHLPADVKDFPNISHDTASRPHTSLIRPKCRICMHRRFARVAGSSFTAGSPGMPDLHSPSFCPGCRILIHCRFVRNAGFSYTAGSPDLSHRSCVTAPLRR